MKALGVVDRKNDQSDAKVLAQIRSSKMIAHCYIPLIEIRGRQHSCAAGSTWLRRQKNPYI